MYRAGSIDHGKLRFTVGDGVSTIRTTNTYNDEVWYYAVGTSDGSNTYLYVNGQQEAAGSTSSIGTPSTVSIGGDPIFNNSRWFLGNIAIASIYNRALSSDEILQNYNALKNRFV